MAEQWVVMRNGTKVMESGAGEALHYARTLDPFVAELEDGLELGDVIIIRAPRTDTRRSEEEEALWSFSRTLHRQIHDASEAAYRGETNKAMELLHLVRDRVNHFIGKQP
jgi:hypothetical protein